MRTQTLELMLLFVIRITNPSIAVRDYKSQTGGDKFLTREFFIFKSKLAMYKLVILFFVSIVFFNSCDRAKCSYANKSVLIKNNSNINIYYYFYWLYPDTSIGAYNPNQVNVLEPGGSIQRGNSIGLCWIDLLSDNKKQYIHFFDADSLRLINWDIIRQTQRGLLERREFDLNYLDSNNWTITYP